MVLPELRLLQAAVHLAQELNFSRAAERLHIGQSTLSKQIYELENEVGTRLFDRDHQRVELTDAGRAFVEEARDALFHAERAVHAARTASNGADEILNIGKSSYTDPFIVTTLLSVRLPLFPTMKIKLWSNFSNELARQVMAGEVDLGVVAGVPDSPKLSMLKLAENPFYIALMLDDELAQYRELSLDQLHNRDWTLLGPHANPHLFHTIQSIASEREIRPSEVHPFTSPEEASELIREYQGFAFLPRHAAWRIAHDGITMRPLADERLRLTTSLAMRSDTKSRLVKEFVRATGRKFGAISPMIQARLPLTG